MKTLAGIYGILLFIQVLTVICTTKKVTALNSATMQQTMNTRSEIRNLEVFSPKHQ